MNLEDKEIGDIFFIYVWRQQPLCPALDKHLLKLLNYKLDKGELS